VNDITTFDDMDDCEDTEEFNEDADKWLDDDMVPLGVNAHVTALLAGELINLNIPEQ
jgi:hypothetical protein